ncbi:acyl-CoA reductase-like NAD-dependent aldehyde dehydrogenase [Deinobacterium chartae]|uniref:Acyl-CoA reductase-like NAD-dependent aldehyde dehydrogenase n=1 Tax=Deinobacterium chartae TaxID=521158 RepID=A0A841I477_9DEIO|nr:aldehyde dehydrogenase family protein [Deinobacterium chartae]MBB6099836.1 acyl-CoA reductase-like NAD-dependent aldehyde dehydrogenase [Deinobacterium chartae]
MATLELLGCPLIIAGQEVETETREVVRAPFDGTPLYSVSQAGGSELRAALEAAVQAQKDFRDWPLHRRAALLRRASALLEAHADEVARVLAREAGKPIKAARVEVGRSVENLAFAADAALELQGETVPLDASRYGEGRLGLTLRVPRGVIAAISPFNFPLNLALHKVGPALAGGNAVILKPAPQTPMTAVWIARLLREAGLPDGLISVLHGGAELGSRLVAAPQVAMVSFTGSAGVGAAIKAGSGLKPVALELGNNSANLVDASAELEAAASKLAATSFAYQGQVCIHPQRLIVHAEVYEAFKERFLEASRKLVLGDPLEEATDVGPLVNRAALERVQSWIREALELGGSLALGGEPQGLILPPTVLENVPSHARVVCEEVFGPVVVLQRAESFDEMIRLANDSRYGLQVGVFTRDLSHALRAAREIEAGGVVVNDPSTFRVDNMPYGGIKDSGFGREGARYTLEEMTYAKLVVLS